MSKREITVKKIFMGGLPCAFTWWSGLRRGPASAGFHPMGQDTGAPAARCSVWGQTPSPTSSVATLLKLRVLWGHRRRAATGLSLQFLGPLREPAVFPLYPLPGICSRRLCIGLTRRVCAGKFPGMLWPRSGWERRAALTAVPFGGLAE
jgi:hypothetical protein